jgi:hypothetical protein
VIAAVLAFGTDLSSAGKSELQRYQELLPSGDPPIKSMCVPGRGYWYFTGGLWRHVAATERGDELVSFVVGLVDTFALVSQSRGQPNLAGYIL